MTPRRKTPTKSRLPSLRTRDFVSQLKREPNELRRKMLLVGFITKKLDQKKVYVYLVGGQAVETYTAGQFTTGDIDITTTDRNETEGILAQLGFKREGMIWLNRKLGLAVQIVGSYPSRSEKTTTISVGPFKVRVVGPEDLIIDRLVAAKFWKSERDGEQALALINVFKKRLDLPYLRKRGREERVEDMNQLISLKAKSLNPRCQVSITEKNFTKRPGTYSVRRGRGNRPGKREGKTRPLST
jgi:hypothetical protein